MPLSISQLKDRERPAPDWILKDFLKRRNTAIIMGQPKRACKSWLILAACWDMSEGLPLWGVMEGGQPLFPVPRPMRCVYFTQEDTEDDIQDRVLAHLNNGGRQPNDRLWVVPKNLQMTLDTTTGRNLIQAELDTIVKASGPIDIVCFDPMRRMHHGDENDSQVITEIWGVVDKIHQRYNCSTLFAHHTVKPPRDLSAYDPTDPYTGRGSGDIYGGGDAFVVVLPGAHTPEQRKVSVFFESKRGRPVNPAQLKVTFKTGQVSYLGAAFTPRSEE